MLSQLLVASSVALNAIICVVIISGLAVFLHDLSGLQTFAALHNLGESNFCTFTIILDLLLCFEHSPRHSHACLSGERENRRSER
jgi:hypothetical protein